MGGPALHPNQEAFIEGVDHILSRWTALELAVENGWGGQTTQAKRAGMVDEISRHFDELVRKRRAPEAGDLEELLLDIMDEDFSVTLDDGSEKAVAAHICQVFGQCRRGDHSEVDRLARERDARGSRSAAQQSTGPPPGSDSESGSELEDGDVVMG
ncbi:rRNA accumulation- protein [Coemansia sp. RSA 552]|nr:rRNA accumulation- protein [Coemansia sp. RSA 552]